jgi:hypothetical protein
MSFARALLIVAAGYVAVAAAQAAEPPRTFGVVDLSDPPAAPAVRARVEREVAGKGLAAVADAITQRALGAGEPPLAAVRRLSGEARDAREAGDCAAALARAREAEETALAGMPSDEARPFARAALGVALGCADALGRADDVKLLSARLRQLGSTPPDGVSPELWSRSAPSRPVPPIELTVDSDPPNARVTVNFHGSGNTPLTVEVPPGEVSVQVEKDGYLKVFRRIVVGPGPARLSLPLAERRRDRAGEIIRRVMALRGVDPGTHRPLIAQVSQLARVDVLVAFVARPSGVTLWWFDAERGEFVGPPVTLPKIR